MKQDIKKWRDCQRRSTMKYADNLRKKNLEKLRKGTLYKKRAGLIIVGFKPISLNQNKGVPYYKKKLWVVFSRYIRLRDSDRRGMCSCITCKFKYHWKRMHAGHFIPKSNGNILYFNEQNVNTQCSRCNNFLSGNLFEYSLALDKKYGPGIAKRLKKEAKKYRSFTIGELITKIGIYQNKVDNLLKIKGREWQEAR